MINKFNGVEIELITAEHFWRLLHKIGFNTISTEREAVTDLCKHSLSSNIPSKSKPNDNQTRVFHEIFEVKSLSKILGQLGISEDIPKSTKNFNYEDLNG